MSIARTGAKIGVIRSTGPVPIRKCDGVSKEPALAGDFQSSDSLLLDRVGTGAHTLRHDRECIVTQTEQVAESPQGRPVLAS